MVKKTFITKIRTRDNKTNPSGRKAIELSKDIRDNFEVDEDVRVTIESLAVAK